MNKTCFGQYRNMADEIIITSKTTEQRAVGIQIKVSAHIARQLTIANEYRESELTVGRAIAEALTRIANVFEARVAFREKPPSPDALVEAVVEELKGVHNCLVLHGHVDKDTPLHKRLDSALTAYLAAHEEAGG